MTILLSSCGAVQHSTALCIWLILSLWFSWRCPTMKMPPAHMSQWRWSVRIKPCEGVCTLVRFTVMQCKHKGKFANWFWRNRQFGNKAKWLRCGSALNYICAHLLGLYLECDWLSHWYDGQARLKIQCYKHNSHIKKNYCLQLGLKWLNDSCVQLRFCIEPPLQARRHG